MADTQLIKDKLDLAQFIGEYVQIKKAGSYWKACCPFHHEKTPSFMIHPERQFWHCFGCFPKGALIQAEHGLKEIENIKKGEIVYTHKGHKKKVERLLVRGYTGRMIKVYTRKSNLPVELTADHEVFAIRTKKCVQKSRATRLCQKQCKQRCPHKYFSSYKIEKIPASLLKLGDFLLYPVSKDIKEVKKIDLNIFLNRDIKKFGKKISKFASKINVDEDFLKLLGYWIAEGSGHRGYLRFSIGGHEAGFAKDIVSLCQKVFGFHASIYKRPKDGARTGTEVTCCNSNLANIFENLCGKGAANKHVPFCFEQLSLPKQRVLLEAIFRGDGHTSKGGKKARGGYRSITTVSHLLAFQLKNILLRLGVVPSIFVSPARIGSDGTAHKQSFRVMWYEDVQATYTDWWEDDGVSFVTYPVSKISSHDFSGEVYNFTIEGDHSYLTENFAVGNCGKGGDIFSFAQEIEGLDFSEALKLLADRAGVKIDTYRSETDKSQRNRILEINQKAAYFFNHILSEMAQSKEAREYLERRQLKQETIVEWEVGYITDQWDLLTQYLLKKGVGVDDLVASGLTIKKDNATAGRGYYDRFRGRIMFPIKDVHGNIVGFTGRQLVENPEAGGKYVNSPQTLVYDKSRVLYGLDKAKMEIKAKDLVVVVEGQMDVIACHQAGMKNVVAASGTALTSEQVRLIERYTKNIAMAFDADKAGINAAKRGIDVALKEGMNVKVIQIPEGAGKDADEVLKKDPTVWFKAVEDATEIMQWFFNIVFAGRKLASSKDQQAASDELLPLIGLIPYAVEKDFWLKKLAETIGTEVAVLREDLKRIINEQTKRSFSSIEDKPVLITKPVKLTHLDSLLERLLMLVIKFPDIFPGIMTSLPDLLTTELEQSKLYETIKKQYNESNDFTTATLLAVLALSEFFELVEILKLKSELEFSEWDIERARKESVEILERLKDEDKKARRQILQQEINIAEKAGNQDRVKELLAQFQNL